MWPKFELIAPVGYYPQRSFNATSLQLQCVLPGSTWPALQGR